MMIAILDYGVGNLKSIQNMFKKIGVKSFITSRSDELLEAEKYLLPGVGAFDYGISRLKESSFFESLEREVLEKKKPILGICLGMQLLTNGSEEGAKQGLGWIDAETLKFKEMDLAVPHMGWNSIAPKDKRGLFHNLGESRFYFVHSYYVSCKQDENILATTSYGLEFSCSIGKENIFGVQFHPEKSHKFGMQLFKNFGEL